MMPQVKGRTSGLNIWARANFMNVIPACLRSRGRYLRASAGSGKGAMRLASDRVGQTLRLSAGRAGPALAPTLTDAGLRSLEACARLRTGADGRATTPTTASDAVAQPSVRKRLSPWRSRPAVLQASLSKDPEPADGCRTQLPPLHRAPPTTESLLEPS